MPYQLPLGLPQPPPSALQLSTTPPPPPTPPPLRPPRILLMPPNQGTATNPPTPPTPPSPLKTAMAIASTNTASPRTRTRTKFARASSQARSLIIMCRRIRRGSLEAISRRSGRMVLEGTRQVTMARIEVKCSRRKAQRTLHINNLGLSGMAIPQNPTTVRVLLPPAPPRILWSKPIPHIPKTW
jgi:hypothetical protein